MIKLRFVHGTDFTSKMIEARSQAAHPFTPSHVECVTPEGKYLGEHFSGGMQSRDPGYDKGSYDVDLIVSLPATDEQTASFYQFMESKIGEPYDWQAIIDYAVPVDLHLKDHAICSAICTQGLLHCGWITSSAVKPYLVDPRDLLLMVSMKVNV